MRWAVLLLGCFAALGAGADGVLGVDGVSGGVSLNRLGAESRLKPGDTLVERDVVQVGEGGSLSLGFAGHGFIELGPGTELGIEKLPFASYSDDLKTIFSLTRGYLRVVWRLPELAGNWPLFVYFGGQDARLQAGEYFFDSRTGTARACVAAGELSVLANTGSEIQVLRAPSCFRLAAGRPAQRIDHDPGAWISMRRSFDIDAPTSPEALLAQGDGRQAGGSGPAAAVQPEPAAVPVPPPASPPERRPVTASPGAESWVVNLASYPDVADAARQVRQLKTEKFKAAVQQAQVRAQTWYRVQLVGYVSAASAHTAAEELQSRHGYRGAWIARGESGARPAQDAREVYAAGTAADGALP